MKKRLLSFIMLFSLGLGFIGGCKKDDNKEQAVLIVDGKEIIATVDGVNYSANQIYESLLTLDSSADYIYEKLDDLLIKTIVPVSDSMRSKINNEVEKWKNEIKDNATVNGKSYKEALKEALEKENASSEEELIENKIFALQKQIIANDYSSKTKDISYENFILNGKIYHISQILVNISTNGNSDAFGVSISESAAKKLYDVVNSLLKGESFYNVALQYSDDYNSKNNGGDMGLITLNDAISSSLPAELKYALASYSVYFENADLDYPEYLNEVYENGIETIPQKYIDLLGEIYKDDSTKYINTDVTGTNSTYTSSRVYGKNIIFNNLFNSRTFRFIQSNETTDVKEMSNIKMPVMDSSKFSPNTSAQNILTNENGYPILVVRSDSGIHFVSISMSAYADQELLKTYYAKKVNYDDEVVSYLEKSLSDSDKTSRLEKLETMAQDYSMYKITNNSSFSGNDTYKQYNMFKYYLENGYNGTRFSIVNETIKNIVNNYINDKFVYENQKIKNQFSQNYLEHSNKVWYTDYDMVTKEIPILDCLEKDTEGKYKCTYTYKDGFESYEAGGAE